MEYVLFWKVQLCCLSKSWKTSLMKNKIDPLAKSNFTSPAQKTSKRHIVMRKERHKKLENCLENKYRTSLFWRLGRKRTYEKEKQESTFLLNKRNAFGKKKRKKKERDRTGPRNSELLPLSGDLTQDRGRKLLQPVLGVSGVFCVNPWCYFCSSYRYCDHEQQCLWEDQWESMCL